MAITDMTGDGDAVTTAFPVARAAYVIDREASNLPAVLDDLLERDPLRSVRAEMRTHYLGDAPPERYAEVFLTEARRCLTGEAASTGEGAGTAPIPAGGRGT